MANLEVVVLQRLQLAAPPFSSVDYLYKGKGLLSLSFAVFGWTLVKSAYLWSQILKSQINMLASVVTLLLTLTLADSVLMIALGYSSPNRIVCFLFSKA